MNGSADIECGKSVLIDGAHGDLKVTAGSHADLHLDSSLERAKVSAPEITIRTPPDQNCHHFKISKNANLRIKGFSKETVSETETETILTLVGENTAGHPRKLVSQKFAGVIELNANNVLIQAESWAEKQIAQKDRFPKNAESDTKSNFRFY